MTTLKQYAQHLAEDAETNADYYWTFATLDWADYAENNQISHAQARAEYNDLRNEIYENIIGEPITNKARCEAIGRATKMTLAN